MSHDFTEWMTQQKKASKGKNNDYLWELTTKHKKVNIVNDFDEKIMKHYWDKKNYPCLYNKLDNDYKHKDVEKRLWTATGAKLEVEGKALKVNLKKLLSKRRIKIRGWHI